MKNSNCVLGTWEQNTLHRGATGKCWGYGCIPVSVSLSVSDRYCTTEWLELTAPLVHPYLQQGQLDLVAQDHIQVDLDMSKDRDYTSSPDNFTFSLGVYTHWKDLPELGPAHLCLILYKLWSTFFL